MNNDNDGKINFVISYSRSQFPISFPLNGTVGSLKEHIYTLTSVPPSAQKLMYKGLLKNGSTLLESNIASNAKILLVGATEESIHNLEEVEVRRANQKVLAPAKPFNTGRSGVNSQDARYTFDRIETLQGFSDGEAARKYLERLRDDTGVKAVMTEHRWKVGALIELHPDEREILGFNRNKGQVIALRIRTDDLTGFRIYSSVREVLMHELAHMVHSEHDNNFHMLNRQLLQEVVKLDWKAKGHTISSSSYYNPEDQAVSVDARGYQGGAFLLGGRSMTGIGPSREVLANAAELRLTKEEVELDNACGSKNRKGDKNTKDETMN